MDYLEQYKKLNNSFKKEFVFHFGTGAGFYSEYNNMLLCMLHCLKYRIKFYLYSEDETFLNSGLDEIFIPFCPQKRGWFHHKFNTRDIPYLVDHKFTNHIKYRLALTAIYLYKMCTGKYITSDLFYVARTSWFECAHFDIPELGIKGGLQDASSKLIDIVYRFNDDYHVAVEKMVSNLYLPSNYVGLHIRGGDKQKERDLFSVEKYMSSIPKEVKCKNIFLMTDDYRIYEELKVKYPIYNFYTLTRPDELGYNNASFLASNKKVKKCELIKMFASMEILRKAECVIGTYSSNPGMFLGMCIPSRMHGIDLDKWHIL